MASHTVHLGRMGPSVRNLLTHYGLDSALIAPTGPRQTLLKGDVLGYIHSNNLQPPPINEQELTSRSNASTSASPRGQSWTDVPVKGSQVKNSPLQLGGTKILHAMERMPRFIDIEVSSMRRTIAKRLLQSKQTIPHAYASIDCNINSLISLRRDINRRSETKTSLNDFIIKLTALSLRQVKEVNARWNEGTGQVELLPNVDISLAVAIPDGLITPIVKNANSLSVVQISKTVRDLAERARAGALQPHEFQGGTFSISNLGMFGIDEFSAVINPPQAAILAVGGSRRRYMPARRPTHFGGISDETVTSDSSDEMHATDVMSVTLSYDSRVCTQIDAARFIETFRIFVEDPEVVAY